MRRRDLLAAALLAGAGAARAEGELAEDSGFRGIWYSNQPSRDEYRFKYSGGLATYPQQHIPIAVHVPEAAKTFFVYGGRPLEKNELLHMVAFFDHRTRRVSRPRILLNKKTTDAHDNPTLAVDGAGHLWIFSNSHGQGRPSYIHRSLRPHSIDAFERVVTTNFSYGQPWHLPEHGFVFLHTRYGTGVPGVQRVLHLQSSADGREWSAPRPFAGMELGSYQVSWPHGSRLATVFDLHPRPVGLNARTNLYYLESRDGGRSWTTVDGRPVSLPVTDPANPALVRDYRKEGLLVYLKDLSFDEEGRPVVLYLTSRGYEAGPANGPRVWWTARWTGEEWEYRRVTESGNNYDHGSLYLEGGVWRIIAPTTLGPQPYNPGGEMAMWESRDRGGSWTRRAELTRGSRHNHTYARRPLHAHPDFYALWADGHARQPSDSRLYFCTRDGRVFRLPERMDGPDAEPEPIG